MNILLSFLFPVLGYLSGSLPFSIWVTRYVKNVDVRDAGSCHATTTNTIRQAGFGWGALVLILDLAKGFIPTILAIRYSHATWVVTLTAALAVAGHCWPLFAQFRGGMGLATLGGALLAANWFSFIVGLGLLLTLTITIRHSARASVFTGIFLAPLFWPLTCAAWNFGSLSQEELSSLIVSSLTGIANTANSGSTANSRRINHENRHRHRFNL